jgi:phage terminase small subunit
MALSNKQKAFIEHYLRTWNATEAARLAGYKGNAVTLATVGSENIRKPAIAAVIAERLGELAMEADEVLVRLSDQARASIEDFIEITPLGAPTLDLKKAQEAGKLHLIKKLNYDADGNLRSIELYDAQSALVQMGRSHGIFLDRVKDDPEEEAFDLEEWREKRKQRRQAVESDEGE